MRTLKNISFFFACNVLFSIVELALHRMFFFAGLPQKSRMLVTEAIMHTPGVLVIFLLQFVLCLLVLAVVTELLRVLFRVPGRGGMQIFVLVISLLYNLAEIPQVFTMSVSANVLVLAKWAGLGVLLALPVWSGINAIRSRRKQNLVNFFGGILTLAGLILLCWRGPTFITKLSKPDFANLKDGSVVVLSLDSLRPEFVKDYARRNPDSQLAWFLQEGVEYQNIVTTTAKTHTSLSSLLTGLDPEGHGLRDNILPGFRDSDRLYGDRGLIPKLRAGGFRTEIIIDETKFADFVKGRAFDGVHAPAYGYLALLVTEAFNSSLFWSYFSNAVGHFLIPSSKMNVAFAQGYESGEFLAEVYRQLRAPSSGPLFLLAHTCSLHYPGQSRSPYLQRYQTNPQRLVTRYPNYFQDPPTTDQEYLLEYKNLARGNFDLVMDEMVEPFLKTLRESGKLERIHFLLMSDHGETFWNPGLRYSRLQLPYHGQPAILDEDSQFMFALMLSPGEVAQKISRIQSITDLTKRLEELVAPKEPAQAKDSHIKLRYSESGILGRGIFNSALGLARRLGDDGYEFTVGGGLQIRASYVNSLVVQKTRSIFFDDHHWSFFPTDYGYETLVCRTPECWSPSASDLAELPLVAEFLNEKTKLDQRAGVGLKFLNRISAAGDVLTSVDDLSRYTPEARWFYGVHKLNAEGRPAEALKAWWDVLNSDQNARDIRFRAFRSMAEVCTLGPRFDACEKFWNWIRRDTASDVSLLKYWHDTDARWASFLKSQSWLQKIGESFAINDAIKRDVKAENELDEFQKLVQAASKVEMRKQQLGQKQVRTYIDKNRKAAQFGKSFYRKFWSALSPDVVHTEVEALSEVNFIKQKFQKELRLKFYEVDREWVSFLYQYTSLTGFDVASGETESLVRENRLPLLFLTSFAIRNLGKIEDAECYRKQILPELLSGLAKNAGGRNVTTLWQLDLCNKARALKRCQNK